MNGIIIGKYELTWTPTGFWMNHADGHNVARFSRFGRDIHANAEGECLACAGGRQTRADWDRFCADLFESYGIRPPRQAMPEFL